MAYKEDHLKFYVLKNPPAGSLYETRFDEENLKTGDAPDCPVCGRTVGMLEWLPPKKITLRRYGKVFGDIIIGIDMLVSENFRLAWLAENLRGIGSFESVEVLKIRPAKAASQAPCYWHVTPPRTTTAADYGKSTFVWDRPPSCEFCGGAGMDAVAGFVIDQSTWTGEDFFRLRNVPGLRIVTQRFADMVHKHNLTNALMIPVEQYVWDPLHKIVRYSKHKN